MAITINSTDTNEVQSSHVSAEDTSTEVEQSTDTTEQTDVSTETTTDTSSTEETSTTTEEPKTDTDGEETTDGTDSSDSSDTSTDEDTDVESQLFFGEQQINIKVDPTHREELAAHGLDADAVVKELFAKGNEDLKLSDETYDKLVKAFGKFSVDTYLGSLKQQVDFDIKADLAAAEEHEKATEALWQATLERVGGEEGWKSLEQYALENLSDAELNDFNDVMNTGNAFTQKLAIDHLMGQMKAHKGDGRPDLITADSVPQNETQGGALSRAEYIKEVARVSKEFQYDKDGYRKAMADLDARRAMA